MAKELPSSVANYDMEFLRGEFCERFLHSAEDFDEAVGGLKTFFAVAAKSRGPLAITNKLADDLWHTFILFTPQYREFCSKYFGRYFDHQPNTSSTPVPPEAFLNWFDALDSQVGGVDDFWRRDLPHGVIESLARKEIPDVQALKWSGWTG